MKSNQKKNIALVIATSFLFLAMFDGWQYGFFTILRFVVFTTTAYVTWMAFEEKRERWIWILGSVAILFNPFIPIYLTREIWIVIDFLTGILLIASIFFLKLNQKLVT